MIYTKSNFSPYIKSMMNKNDAFIKVIKKYLKVRNKINVMLDRYTSLPYNYQSKISYDTLIQNVILKELNNIMARTTTDLDIELKLKISRIEYLEKKTYIFVLYK